MAAAKFALKSATGEQDESGEAGASWPKKVGAASLGLLAAFYLVNQLVTIVPILNQLHYLMALGIMWWSLGIWGVRPLKLLKERRTRKKLAAASESPKSKSAEAA